MLSDNLSAPLLCDFYKVSHRPMYPQGTELVYSTWTPRASRKEGIGKVVVFGQQAFIKNYLIDFFNAHFFNRSKTKVIAEYKRVLKYTLGIDDPDASHIEALHDVGYMPLLIKSLPEGCVAPLRVPTTTIMNTDPRFFWLTNSIESLMSCELWQSSTSATIALEYRKILDRAALETVGDVGFVQFQGHDFSMRGMSSMNSGINSGMGHLLSFVGTDTIPAIQAVEYFYNGNIEQELIGTSIPATEHSIQCAYADDLAYLSRMMTEVHPSGFVSIVSDGYDFWDVIGRVIPALKDKILARDGRVVIRPDSGDPVKIVCGDPDAPEGSLARIGAVEALWNIFGGTMTEKGYKLLDSHIGLIYGDSISLERAQAICDQLKAKGFASINCVYGIGSYSYQYNTRDTFGFALKSTLCVVNGQERQIFKDPKTDDGIKKSQKGRVAVLLDDKGEFYFVDGLGLNDAVEGDQLRTIFENGKLVVDDSFAMIRARLVAARYS